jgi:hypothetical protein
MSTVMARGTVTLTPAGQLKINSVIRAAIQGAEIGLFRAVEAMRDRAAAIAPSPTEEAELLSAGTPDGGFFGGATIGTPWAFLREGMVPVQEAIRTDPIVVERAGGATSLVQASTGSVSRISARTGFSWMTRSRGVQGPTLPYDRQWLYALEFGGAWEVTPRGDWQLEPEEGIFASRMHKTVAPRAMYSRARATGRGIAMSTVANAIKQHVKAVA